MRPNFFIVGAPKCGTTALSKYLSEHPNIFISDVKEPHYFADDLPKYRYVTNESDYLSMFDSANATNHRIGEASVFYLYSKVAIENIKKFDPNARIIVMLRNPLDMVCSMHSQLLYTRDETTAAFAMAWDLCGKRKQGQEIPTCCRDEKLLFYDEIGMLGAQVERLLNVFARDQVKIIFYDDFASNTTSVYQETLYFLGLPFDERSSFSVVNSNKKHKSSLLAQFTQKTPPVLVRGAMKLKAFIGISSWGILDKLRNMNTSAEKRPPLDVDLRTQLVDCYHDDIEKLALLTGRDLSAWLR